MNRLMRFVLLVNYIISINAKSVINARKPLQWTNRLVLLVLLLSK